MPVSVLSAAGPFDALFGPALAPAPTMAFAPMATSG